MQYFNSGLNPGIKSYILNEKNTTNPYLHPNSRVAGKTGRKNMYSSIIEVKKTVPYEALVNLRRVAEGAFSNREAVSKIPATTHIDLCSKAVRTSLVVLK